MMQPHETLAPDGVGKLKADTEVTIIGGPYVNTKQEVVVQAGETWKITQVTLVRNRRGNDVWLYIEKDGHQCRLPASAVSA